jgi:RNA polymerase sigma-70 factor (ECF subfamily)
MIEATKQFQPELFRSYLRVLARVALRSRGALQNKIDASDLVQSALLQAVEALPQFRGQSDQEFAAWLRRILANRLADQARHFGRQKRDAALEDSYCETLGDSARRLEQIPADLTTPSQHVMQNEKTRCLAECLAALPPDQQMAVELHHLAGYSLSEIAQRMKKSKASVAGLLRRGLQNLRESLKEKEHILR